MSGHNMSGDMYARFVQKCQEEYYFLFVRMVAEQTAAYQKQMWLSQLQVTNPQAYQVRFSLPYLWIIFIHRTL